MAVVSFPPVANFDSLSIQAAENILYNELIPACEAKKVELYSSDARITSLSTYDEKKKAHKLFNVEVIQKAFALIDQIIRRTSEFQTTAFSLKFKLEDHPSKSISNKFISPGDVVAAMLLKGYEGKYEINDRAPPGAACCEFKS